MSKMKVPDHNCHMYKRLLYFADEKTDSGGRTYTLRYPMSGYRCSRCNREWEEELELDYGEHEVVFCYPSMMSGGKFEGDAPYRSAPYYE